MLFGLILLPFALLFAGLFLWLAWASVVAFTGWPVVIGCVLFGCVLLVWPRRAAVRR